MKELYNGKLEEFEPGKRILTKGDRADKTYLIVSGTVRVFIEKDGKIVELASLSDGEIFGETALFEDSFYGANVEAVTPVKLHVITPGWLDDAIDIVDPIVAALLRMLISRLRATNEALVRSETRGFIDIGFV